MIITPHELQLWIDEGKPFTVVDFRPKVQRRESPLSGLNAVIADADTIPKCDGAMVLVCQFGIVTEEIMIHTVYWVEFRHGKPFKMKSRI